ncbi:phosphonate ABC transporter, permease protein PhnE [Rhodovulum tesquicola]|uniref:phosphonate ABC transporter, permease protein PhnE n=1 Tax=Rhodovulum tesquicola TaxID=540254 RepID=UPI00209742C1|nr:phosphonate ABC transporter, permease protein PhnE [Rhodovulum tesquicola]MCO8146086.1 phosphonate ABC transporter, permease protein PhnE [Rhodovulum tesquicola]
MTAIAEDARKLALGAMRRKRAMALAAPVLLMAYFAYVFVAFDVSGLVQRAKMDNAVILLSDAVSYKIHATRDNRSDALAVSVEGSRRATYPEDRIPDWIRQDGDRTLIELTDGHSVTYDGPRISYDHPDYGPIRITIGNPILLDLPQPGPVPDFINASDARVVVTTDAGRLTVTRTRTDTFRYFWGWELFFFDLQSPFHGMSAGTLAATVAGGERLHADRPNWQAVLHDFLNNSIWRHGDVFFAIGETALMAFLGTFGAAAIALPLAFLAAQNFTPSRWLRFAVRRVFDFVRGVDALIFTIILSRAFGPGPMTGALAILITDSGSFGKLFSEALENTDQKQIEGVQSTGANALQRYRFGVIPQVMPLLLSQLLYFLESNTRSATIIGAIVGGGIGLMLTQAIQTTADWEKVTYYMVLIVLLVIAMDALSGWLRRRLIKGD